MVKNTMTGTVCCHSTDSCEASAVLPTVASALSEQIPTQWKKKIKASYDKKSFDLAGTTGVYIPHFEK